MTPVERLQAMLDAATAPAPTPVSGRELDPRLHGYQRRAVQHLWDNPSAALWLDVGLGKSAIVLQALTPEFLPALFIGPPRVVKTVHREEPKKWRPDLSVAIADGGPAQRKRALASGADIVAISDHVLKDVPDRHGFKTVVYDESSRVKSRQSARWRQARRIVKTAERVVELTGTPSPNGLMDIWSQMFLLDRGERLETGITKYRSRYFTPGRQLASGVVTSWDLRPGASEKIHAAVSDICLSMSAEDYLDLPPVTFNDVSVPLDGATMGAYRRMKKDLVLDADHTAANAAVATSKLSQIAAGFLYGDEGKETIRLHDEKTKALQEILDGTGSPVLVFYRFREEYDRLMREIPGAVDVRSEGAIERWNAGEIPVLLAHPASAGHGLNLQHGGHTIVWMTLPWSSEEYQQANGRLARQGQIRSVMVHRMIAPGTVDEAIRGRLEHKISVQDALLLALKEDD